MMTKSTSSRVLGITLARGGSVAVPKKNIRMVAGRPLIEWTIQEVNKCKLIDRYVVSTDSEEIADIVQDLGVEVINRPDFLAMDNTPAIDALIHTLDTVEHIYGEEYSIVADIRTTNPLKLASNIDGAIQKLFSSGADVVCGVSRLDDHHPARIKTIVGDRLIDVWPEHSGNRQDLTPDVFIRNGSIYAVRTTALREGIHFTGGDIRPWLMPQERGVNIDSELDLLICETLLSS